MTKAAGLPVFLNGSSLFSRLIRNCNDHQARDPTVTDREMRIPSTQGTSWLPGVSLDTARRLTNSEWRDSYPEKFHFRPFLTHFRI